VSDIEKFMNGLKNARGPICDDCLAESIGWGQRQRANMIGRPLAVGGAITRERAVCLECGRTKTVNRLKPPAGSSGGSQV
jgi:hypothetical protein